MKLNKLKIIYNVNKIEIDLISYEQIGKHVKFNRRYDM